MRQSANPAALAGVCRATEQLDPAGISQSAENCRLEPIAWPQARWSSRALVRMAPDEICASRRAGAGRSSAARAAGPLSGAVVCPLSDDRYVSVRGCEARLRMQPFANSIQQLDSGVDAVRCGAFRERLRSVGAGPGDGEAVTVFVRPPARPGGVVGLDTHGRGRAIRRCPVARPVGACSFARDRGLRRGGHAFPGVDAGELHQ